MALYTEGAMPLHKVTCVTRGHALGLVSLVSVIHIELDLTASRHNSYPLVTEYLCLRRSTRPALMCQWVVEWLRN